MSLLRMETIAGRGGPDVSLIMRTVVPSGRVQGPKRNEVPTTMPPCPGCKGTGSRFTATATGLDTVCGLCHGDGTLPRLEYNRIIRGLAIMSLETESVW